MLECVCVCVCRVSYRVLTIGRGELQSSVLTWRGCIAHNNLGGLGACSPSFLKFFLDALRLILRHSGGTCRQF